MATPPTSASPTGGGGINVAALRAVGGDEEPKKSGSKDPAGVDLEAKLGPTVRAILKKGAGSYYSGALKALGQFDPEKITYEQMYMMRRDPMIALGLKYIIAPLVNAPWKIKCPDRQQGAFVEEALKEIYVPLVQGICTMLAFGHAGIIKRFDRRIPTWLYTDETGEEVPVWDDDTIKAVVWDLPRVLPPETVNPAFTEDGQHFDGLLYKPGPNMKDKDEGNDALEEQQIPVGHALWAINEREESFGNWAGYPRTGYAFRYWWSYWYNYILADRHFEQDADPPAEVKYPIGKTLDPDTGEEVDNATLALNMGDAIREGATLAVPSDTWEDDLGKPSSNPKWSFRFVSGGENMGTYIERFRDLRIMKLTGMLIPPQALMETTGGSSSRNAAATAVTTFNESLGILMHTIDTLINRYMIPDLLRINFETPADCRKVTTGFRSVDTAFANTILSYIVNKDGADLPIDVQELLEQTGIPTLAVNIVKDDPTDSVDTPPPPPDDGGDPAGLPNVKDTPSPDTPPKEIA